MLLHDPAIPLQCIYSRDGKIHIHTKTYTLMFTAVLLKIIKKQKQHKSLINWYMNKQNMAQIYNGTLNIYYAHIKEWSTDTCCYKTWTNFENTVLSAREARHKKTQEYYIPWLIHNAQNRRSIETSGFMEWRVTANEYRVSFQGNNKALRLESVTAEQQLSIL